MNSRKLVVIALSGLFLLTAWSSTWFEISAVGVYSEGLEREPTITTEYIIDSIVFSTLERPGFFVGLGGLGALGVPWSLRSAFGASPSPRCGTL